MSVPSITALSDPGKQYTELYVEIVEWYSFAGIGPRPDSEKLADIPTTELRDIASVWVGVHRIEIRQLIVCKPGERYTIKELVKLRDQARRVVRLLRGMINVRRSREIVSR